MNMKKIEKDIETSERAKREGLRRLPPGSFKARHPDYDPEKAEKKVRVTLYLDSDVLAYFKKRAEQPHAAPYQTQINNELRAVMEPGKNEPEWSVFYARFFSFLIEDKKFIKAVAEEVSKV
jgi:uncharacterized protein (DUF4415 family)